MMKKALLLLLLTTSQSLEYCCEGSWNPWMEQAVLLTLLIPTLRDSLPCILATPSACHPIQRRHWRGHSLGWGALPSRQQSWAWLRRVPVRTTILLLSFLLLLSFFHPTFLRCLLCAWPGAEDAEVISSCLLSHGGEKLGDWESPCGVISK